MIRIKRNVVVTIITNSTMRYCGRCPFLDNTKKYCTLYGEHLVRHIFMDEEKFRRCFCCENEDEHNEVESSL